MSAYTTLMAADIIQLSDIHLICRAIPKEKDLKLVDNKKSYT